MELEILRTHETEIGHIQQKSDPIIPAYYLNHMQMINAENVAKVSVSEIKELAKIKSPDIVFPKIQDFSDLQIQELVKTLPSVNDTKFLNILHTIILMCSDEGIDILEKCGVNINAEHQGKKVVTAYLNNTDTFEVALNRLLFTSLTTDKTYHLFKSSGQIPEFENSQITTQDMEIECKKYFKTSGCGEFCDVRIICPIKTDKRLGFFIDHGGNLKSKRIIDTQDRASLFHGRNLIEDFAIYDPSLELVLISSRSAKHCEFYSRIIGKTFWNDENLFNTQERLNLSFIRKSNIQQLLENCQTGRMTTAQIRKIHILTNDINNSKIVHSTGRSCLIQNTKIHIPPGDIIEIEIALKLNIGGKNRSQKLILKPTSVKYGSLVLQSDIQHIFKQLELIRNENN
ncbi:MAG: hypothetical protein OXM55_03750 [Bdellovibrionales bacterium]|nr:hypothetical protein [Bdellovibrionales bacterium]